MFIKKSSLNINRQKGYALAIVIMLVPLFFLLSATINDRVNQDVNLTKIDLALKQAYYICEAGERAAEFELASCNYSKYTHNPDGTPISGSNRTPITLPHCSIDSEGWTQWKWSAGDTYSSFTDTGADERFRYKVYAPSVGSNKWIIDVEGYYGNTSRKMRIYGQTDTTFKYAIFGNELLSEFTRGQDQTIYGKVHSNGNLYFRPETDKVLTLSSCVVTAAGKMIRYEDAWGRPDPGGTVRIDNGTGTLVIMNGKKQGAQYDGKGKAFDSDNAGWLNPSTGAMAKWNGNVLDGSLGAGKLAAPPLESMSEGGYYHQNASLVITATSSGTGIYTGTSFYNVAEKRMEKVVNLDFSQLPPPANGLIYCMTPVRIINAERLPYTTDPVTGKKYPQPLTIVSNCNIYTQGDVNKVYPDASSYSSGSKQKQPFAIMTTQRIYHLSKGWKDSDNMTDTNTVRAASENAQYSGDAANTLEINAAIVDGPPTVDERNWVIIGSKTNNQNPYYTGSYTAGTNAWANSDDFLEDWGGGKTVKKTGSIVHLENCTMAKLDNSDAGPGVTAWTIETHYNPPLRVYQYDNDLSDPTKQPPFFPKIYKRTLWQLIK